MSTFIHLFRNAIAASVVLITTNATAQPVISSFAPSSGPVGTSVIITGINFNIVPANNIVYFGSVRATVTSGTVISLTATVPAAATYQPISVLNNATGLTGYSAKPFIITFANPFGTGIPPDFYAPKVDFIAGTNPRNAILCDMDGDGKSDLVVANGNSNTLSILRNISTPGIITASSFAAKVDFATGTFTAYLIAGDVDGDGKPDLVVVNNNNLSVLRNTSTAGIIDATSFAAKIDFDLVFTGPVFVAMSDFDGDGKPDLVSANSASASASVLRNTSTPGIISFAPKVNFSTGATPSSIAIVDLDKDGKSDLIVTNAGVGANTVSVLRNISTTGIISFVAKVDFTTGTGPRSVATGDVDGDGRADLVVSNSDVASTTLSVLRNTSVPGSIDLTSFATKVDFTTGTAPRFVAMGDADGDGRVDLVVANVNATSISVLHNVASPGTISAASFDAKVDFTTGTGPVAVAIGDIDGDGIPEIATANGTASSVSVFQIDLAAVPVSLTNVKVYQKNSGVQIEWTTAQEINIENYEVERSQNGWQFIKLGTVQPGGSNVTKNYTLFDPNPFVGASFYRIKIVETGKMSYSQVLKVNIDNSFPEIVCIYPNPVMGKSFELQLNLPKAIYTIVLLNMQGQQVFTKLLMYQGNSATETIELPKLLTAGVYQLRISGNGNNIVRQIIYAK